MAYLRKLASGRWQATVRLPDGQRRSYSHRLKSAVQAWASEMERDARHGEAIDPRHGDTTVGELWERYGHARHLELASRRRDESHWRCHVAPRWEATPVATITRPDISGWVDDMQAAGAGAWSIHAAVRVLRAILRTAVDARLIRANPATGVRLPSPPEHADRVLDPEEREVLLTALDAHRPGRLDGRLMAELLLWCGLRWEEAAGLGRGHVLMRDRLIRVAQVVERDGSLREYPKTGAGSRVVPVPDHLWPRLRERAMAVSPGGLLITAPRGGVLGYPTWRSRVWVPAVGRAGLADPQPTPHDLRHTYGTSLAEAGVPAHEIMALMGHSTLRSVQRYLHAGPGRYDRARAAMALVHSRSASNQRHELK